MNWKKIFASKKIFLLSLLPIILMNIFDYKKYLDRKDTIYYDGCGWVDKGQGCKNYFDYVNNSLFGWEFFIYGHIILFLISFLLIGMLYFTIHKKKKTVLSFFVFLVIMLFLLFLIRFG